MHFMGFSLVTYTVTHCFMILIANQNKVEILILLSCVKLGVPIFTILSFEF